MMTDLYKNPLLWTDAYNFSHEALKINTDHEVSHVYNRTSGAVVYGVNEIIQRIFSSKITMDNVREAEYVAKRMNCWFPTVMFETIVCSYNGLWPLQVEAIPDGTWIPTGTPFIQVENTVTGFGELVTWLEGCLLHSHFPMYCATEAYHMRMYLEDLRKQYHYPESFIQRFHSFGFRGHRSLEDAYWASTAWNLFLSGTDDVIGIIHTPSAKMSSIAAQGHKVTQQFDNELTSYYHAIDQAKEHGKLVVAVVIDTYDAHNFIKNLASKVAMYAAYRNINVVFRPDSNNVLTQAIDIYTNLSTNYPHLLPFTSVIIGMDMDFATAKSYDRIWAENKFPLHYINYGIGSGFYNNNTRDSVGLSMKTAFSNGKPRMKFSNDPIKQSIPGRIIVRRNQDGRLVVEPKDSINNNKSLLKTVYVMNGWYPEVNPDCWNAIHDRANELLNEPEHDNQEAIEISEDITQLIEKIKESHHVSA